MSLIRKIKDFFWWIRIILTFGDVIEVADDSGDQWTVTNVCYNGKVSSFQLFLVTTSVNLSLSFCRLITGTFDAEKNSRSTGLHVARTRRTFYFNFHRSRILSPSSTQPRDSYTLFGITVFYFFGCSVDIFHAFLSASCLEVWGNCRSVYHTATGWLHLLFHVYLGGQTLFCIVFDRSTMVDRCSTRCGMMYLAAVNVCLSVDCLIDLIVAGNQVENPKVKCYADDSNVSVEAIQRIQQDATMLYFMNTYVLPIFIPITIQMTVLTGIVCGTCSATAPPATPSGGHYLRGCRINM